jgi:hypothetical protein
LGKRQAGQQHSQSRPGTTTRRDTTRHDTTRHDGDCDSDRDGDRDSDCDRDGDRNADSDGDCKDSRDGKSDKIKSMGADIQTNHKRLKSAENK